MFVTVVDWDGVYRQLCWRHGQTGSYLKSHKQRNKSSEVLESKSAPVFSTLFWILFEHRFSFPAPGEVKSAN